MITLVKFWQGRDVKYASELTKEIKACAAETIRRVNALLARAALDDRSTDGDANSGWRPQAVNAALKGAALLSKHMKGQAVDVEDADKALQRWCMANLDVLEELGLWMEHPRDTPTWTHLQIVPPRSGKRVFYAK
jgi:hypothetical protein